MSEFVQFSENDGVATITFNRADIYNAIGLEEILAIYSQLRRWRSDDAITGVVMRGDGFRAFSSGENVLELHQALVSQDQAYLAALARGSHRLVRLWGTYPKPTMAVMNGVTLGLGAALAVSASIRVVTELTLFSVSHCRLGLVPDAGMAYYLAKCPGKIGQFLALTGMEIRAPGMLHAGLGSHYVQPQDVDWVSFANVEDLNQPPLKRPLAEIQPEIDRCFDQRTVQEIEMVLGFRPEAGFRDILGQLRIGEPTALDLTFRHINNAAGRPFEDILLESYRLTRRLINNGNAQESIRARFIDRDGKMSWKPVAIDMETYFSPLTDEPELYFDKN